MQLNNTPAQGLVSIVMPTFNHGEFIGEAIDSIRAQTYAFWELIVVNNYSTDDTTRIVESYHDARICLVNCRNHGIIAASRNEGIRRSGGQYVALLDSDDRWVAEKLARQVEVMRKRPEVLLVATNIMHFPGGERVLFDLERDLELRPEELAKYNPIGNSSVLMRRELVDLVGFFDESKEIVSIEDYDYWLRVMDRKPGSILILKEPLMLYRVHPTNVSRLDDEVKVWQRHAFVYAKFRRASFYRTLKRRSAREITRLEHRNLVNGKIGLRECIKDRRIPFHLRLVCLAKYVLSSRTYVPWIKRQIVLRNVVRMARARLRRAAGFRAGRDQRGSSS